MLVGHFQSLLSLQSLACLQHLIYFCRCKRPERLHLQIPNYLPTQQDKVLIPSEMSRSQENLVKECWVEEVDEWEEIPIASSAPIDYQEEHLCSSLGNDILPHQERGGGGWSGGGREDNKVLPFLFFSLSILTLMMLLLWELYINICYS